MNFYDIGYDAAPLIIGIAVAFLAILLLQLLTLIGWWRTLQKMGRHDFAALVPGYNLWELSRGAGFTVGLAAFFVIVYAVQSLVPLVIAVGLDYQSLALQLVLVFSVPVQQVPETLSIWAAGLAQSLFELYGPLLVATVVAGVLAFVLQLYAYYGVARSFGHGVGYVIGLLLFPFIFFMVLGCSSKQRYRGPYLDKTSVAAMQLPWDSLVTARRNTFGSNAPLALALGGLAMGAVLLSIPGIALCIAALVKNSGEKGKPLAVAKCTVTTVVSVLGIVISVGLVAFLFLCGGTSGLSPNLLMQ